MPREIYNEGRVVGYSAYELYVKHSLSENPEIEPATEREWLSAQLGHGASMILRVTDTDRDRNGKLLSSAGMHCVDYPLPTNSKLCTANVIIGSQFFGECKFDSKGWATKITDYGQMISNVSSKHPSDSTVATSYPEQDLSKFADTNYTAPSKHKPNFLQYIKIQDGAVLQPGAWRVTTHRNPYDDFTPNLSKTPVVRLVFASAVTDTFYILLTGFTNRSIISGIVGVDEGSTAEVRPENGDFIGPELFPWANKIIFMHSPITSYYGRYALAENWRHYATGSISATQANQYNIKITHDENEIDTIFKVSDLYAGNGIAVQTPLAANPGGPITISSVISPTNKFLKVDQSAGSNASNVTTQLTVSPIVKGAYIIVTGPATNGANVTIAFDTAAYYRDVIAPIWSEISSIWAAIGGLGDQITSVSNSVSDLADNMPPDLSGDVANVWKALQKVIQKVVGNDGTTINTSNGNFSWAAPANNYPIMVGNMNVYSTNSKRILGHKGTNANNDSTAGDLEVK